MMVGGAAWTEEKGRRADRGREQTQRELFKFFNL
jgi:hypothetical protein